MKQFLRQIVYVEKTKHLSIDHETADFNLHPVNDQHPAKKSRVQSQSDDENTKKRL